MGHGHRGLILAATQNGVASRGPGGTWRYLLSDFTVWSVILLPDDHTIVAGDEAGNVLISHDAGKHWLRRQISSQGVYAVTFQPGHPRVLLAGAGGGFFRSDDAGLHWRRTLALPGSAGAAFAWPPGSRTTVFGGAVAGAPGGATKVYVSRDAGVRWRLFGHGLGSRAGIMSLAAGPRHALFAGTMGNRIWRIPLGGIVWRQDASGIPAGQHVAGIDVVPGHSSRLYLGTLADGVFVSDDAGSHWTSVSAGLPAVDGAQLVLAVAYARREHAVYAATIDGVYRHPVRAGHT